MVTILALLLTGCTSLHSLQGAKTHKPKTWEYAVGTSLQSNNALSSGLGVPVPQMTVAVRYGWKPKLDVGLQAYLGGGLIDMRYEFFTLDDWTLAVAPGIGGLYGGVLGNVDLRIPVRAEKSLSDKWSITLGVTPMTQHTFVWLPSANETLTTPNIGTSIRMVRHRRRINVGYTIDVNQNIGRGMPPAWSTGLDWSIQR